MITISCRNAHSDLQRTESFMYACLIRCKHAHVLLSLTFKENTISNVLLYSHLINTYQQGSSI